MFLILIIVSLVVYFVFSFYFENKYLSDNKNEFNTTSVDLNRIRLIDNKQLSIQYVLDYFDTQHGFKVGDSLYFIIKTIKDDIEKLNKLYNDSLSTGSISYRMNLNNEALSLSNFLSHEVEMLYVLLKYLIDTEVTYMDEFEELSKLRSDYKYLDKQIIENSKKLFLEKFKKNS